MVRVSSRSYIVCGWQAKPLEQRVHIACIGGTGSVVIIVYGPLEHRHVVDVDDTTIGVNDTTTRDDTTILY